jgi:hypothetical protein
MLELRMLAKGFLLNSATRSFMVAGALAKAGSAWGAGAGRLFPLTVIEPLATAGADERSIFWSGFVNTKYTSRGVVPVSTE